MIYPPITKGTIMKKIILLMILSFTLFADDSGDTPIIQNQMSMEQIQKLTPQNPIGDFGYSVGVSRWGTLVIGSPSENKAYIYEYDRFLGTYIQQAIIEPNDGLAGDKFGSSVATTGSSVVVGSYEHNNTGAIYIYKTTTKWMDNITFVGKFVGDDSEDDDKFGYSVDFDYGSIVVGAPDHNENRGAVYTFYHDSDWFQSAKSEIVDGAVDDKFGHSVAIDYLNDKVIVGAYGANKAYLFSANHDWSTLTKSATLTASDSSAGDRFGISVDIDDSVIVVGADSYSNDAYKAGQAYIYTSVVGDTTESAILNASDIKASSYFGRSVAIDDSKIVVGSRTFGGDGAIYLFEKKDSWVDAKEDKKLSAIDTLSKTKFGDSVAILEDTIYSGYSSYSSFVLQELILCNVVENSTQVVDINATDTDDDITLYQIHSGADQTLFTINSLTGEIAFKSKPDFENPRDADGNNIYELYISVGDSENNLVFTHILVSVSDIKYENPPKASSYKLTQTLEATVPAISDYYGEIVATDGDLVAVLSEKENSDKGVVYLYNKGVKVALLSNDNVIDDDEFGKNILIENSTVYISAHRSGNGKVFVYEKGSGDWADMNTPTATITTELTAGARFGSSLAVDNGILVVGASLDNSKGSVYVFEIPPFGWTNTNNAVKLVAVDGVNGDYFGQDVAIHNNTILVGAFQNSAPANDSGAAYIFTKPLSGWVNSSKSIKLTASDASVDDALGFSVAIYNDTAVVGSFKKNANRGQAYIYEKASTGWSDTNETAILSIVDSEADDYFSYDLDMQGELIAIGALGGSGTGSVYLYDKPINGWLTANSADKILDIPNALSGDFFGISLKLSDDTLVVGSPYMGNVESGEAHIFKGSSANSLPAIIMYLLN